MSLLGRAAILLALTGGLVVPAAPVAADRPSFPGGLEMDGRSTVAAVIDGETVRLSDDRTVRLVGIEAPRPPVRAGRSATWPLADEAKSMLESLVLRRAVSLYSGGRTTDRHGRLLAHLVLDDGGWVQGILLRRGLARVYSFADSRALVGEMLALESAAREARLGIWDHPHYAIRTAQLGASDLGTVQVVEGRIRDAAEIRGRVYLNFGEDWRTDFTVMLDRRALALFRRGGVDPLALRDRRIRVRGWLDNYNGPMIAATHPEQIEVLAD